MAFDLEVQVRALLIVLALAGCTQKPNQAMGILIDSSGTYVDQAPEIIQQIRLVVLPGLRGGDQLVLMKIDSFSYGWDNVLTTLQVPQGRRDAAEIKRQFAVRLNEIKIESSRYTDISGALLYCNEYMRNLDATVLKMLVFSDMQEDLPPGMRRTYREGEFTGVKIAIVNTKRLVGDQRDPESYRKRMDEWQEKIMQHGAVSFDVFMGPDKIRNFMEN
jgi:hypothetical protein